MEAASEAYEQIAKHLRWNLKKEFLLLFIILIRVSTDNVVGVYMQEGLGCNRII
ncbi:MAG: hypothetical protein Ct9H300mP18_13340 [Candidatus Neomarinimicrobiota bacterium]|nr:MAG: hypothetical protein Ct9H300mP18_13340 [Candidatus Neomarinimicrobiota bacterium]